MNSAIKIEEGSFWPEISIGPTTVVLDRETESLKFEPVTEEKQSFDWIDTENPVSDSAPIIAEIAPLDGNGENTENPLIEPAEITTVEEFEQAAIPVSSPVEKPKNTILETEAVTRLKDNLKNHYAGILRLHFDPVKNLSADLFGKFSGGLHIDLFEDESGINEREKSLVLQLLEELVLHCKYAQCNQETIELITPLLLKGNRKDELKQFVNDNIDRIDNRFKMFLDLAEVKPAPGFEISPDTEDLLEVCYLYKHGKLSEKQEDTLYDAVISREYPEIYGLSYFIFKTRNDPYRTMGSLFAMGKKLFHGFSKKEKERFVNDYKHEKEYLQLYFLLKDVYPREIIKKWAEKEKLKSGKVIENPVDESLTLTQKYEQLKPSGLIYTLPAFELLLLLNSEVTEFVRADITAAHERIPHSYLTNKSLAVLKFFDQDFNAFFYHLDRSGRLQYAPENLYLKALACFETDEEQEGERIIHALQVQFPDSGVLENATSLYKIK